MSIPYIGSVDTLYIINKIKAVLDGTNNLGPGYVPKESGKGLSQENFTTTLLNKLQGIQEGADAVEWSQIQQSGTKVATITINGTDIDVYIPTSTAIIIDDAMSDSSTNPVQNRVIKNYVDTAVGAVIGLKFDADTTGLGYASLADLQTKHPTGENGTIYLVRNSGASANTKDEYFWNSAGSTPGYERFGSTDVDLSGYVQTTDLVEVTTSDIDTMFDTVFGS